MSSKLLCTMSAVIGLSIGILIGSEFLSRSGSERPVAEPVSINLNSRAPISSSEATAGVSVAKSPAGVVNQTPRDNLDSAIAEALNETYYERQEELFFKIAASISLSDIPAALKRLSKRSEPQLRYVLMNRLLSRWAEADPVRAMAYVASMKISGVRNQSMQVVIAAWVRNDLPAATDWVKKMQPGQQRDQAMYSVVSAMALLDARKALAFVEALPKGGYVQDFRDAVYIQVAMKDPAAAAAIKVPAGHEYIYSTIASQWVLKDPGATIAWATGLPDGSGKLDAIRSLICGLVDSGAVQAARDFAMSQPQGEVRNMALSSIAAQLANVDLPAAVEWMKQLPEDGQARQNALQCIMGEWAQNDPQSAAAYALTMQPGNVQNKIFNPVFYVVAGKLPGSTCRPSGRSGFPTNSLPQNSAGTRLPRRSRLR